MAAQAVARVTGRPVPEYTGRPGLRARSMQQPDGLRGHDRAQDVGRPAWYFPGSAPYSTWPGSTCPSATMPPPYRNGSSDRSSDSRPYSTPTPNGASIASEENARKSTSRAETSVNVPGTSCAPSASR